MDQAGLLSPRESQSLATEVQRYLPQVQLQIWIVPSLQGEPIENVSMKAAETWKLGTSREDRGAILLVAIEDRQMRLEVGQGLEGEIPDARAARVLDSTLGPAFRQGQYFEGLVLTARSIYKLAGGDLASLPQTVDGRKIKNKRAPNLFELILTIVFIVLAILSSIFGGRRRSRWGMGPGGGGPWGGGFGGGGFGGGGGWSGGGGGFSGGGASGRW
jgi:uncharacterized protein